MKRLVRRASFFAVALLMIPALSACAQTIKVGMIDTQKIMRESNAAKKARDILMNDLEAKRAQFKAEEEQTRKLEEELKRDGQSMTPAARQEKAQNLEKEIRELGRLKSDLEEDFRKKDAELARKIVTDIIGIAKEFQKKEKFTVILEKRYVVAADEAIEVTDKVLRLYDAVK